MPQRLTTTLENFGILSGIHGRWACSMTIQRVQFAYHKSITFGDAEMNNLLNKINAQTNFSNGYTASVVYFPETDEHEVAVLYKGKLVYDTPVTNDVVRCSSAHEAFEIVSEIMTLPKRNA